MYLYIFPTLLIPFCFFMCQSPPSSTLFPYTTLFRSLAAKGWVCSPLFPARQLAYRFPVAYGVVYCHGREPASRSEEHTSELQSREKLVCRLLLEKKKNRKCNH